MSGSITILGQDGVNAASAANPVPVVTPGGAGGPGTPITASSGNVGNATATATLAAVANKTTYITGFQVTALGATSANPVTVNVSGVVTGNLSYAFVFPAGATTPAQPLDVTFGAPVAASGANVTISVALPAGGVGNTNAAVSAQGFQY